MGEIYQPNLDWLLEGFSRVVDQIDRAVGGDSEMVIEILGIEYPLTDYQDDAIALTAVAWAAEEFGFEPPVMDVRFERGQNRYVIEYK